MWGRCATRAGVAALAGVLGAGLLAGCISAFAPGVRARGVHGGLGPHDEATACYACHELERDALRRGATAARSEAADAGPAPLVADWMADDPRPCLDCHKLREGRR